MKKPVKRSAKGKLPLLQDLDKVGQMACVHGRMWFDIMPFDTPKGFKHQALTMRPDSPLYDVETWLHDGRANCWQHIKEKGITVSMMTAYTLLPDNFDAVLIEETGLNGIDSHDTHYTLQVCVDLNENGPDVTLQQIKLAKMKLAAFVDKHFMSYLGEEPSLYEIYQKPKYAPERLCRKVR